MKLSDFVADYLEMNGVEVCFMVSGGAVLHLIDSIQKNSKIRIVCSQHEESAATGADSFSRFSHSKIGLCVATSGPGATNLVTGVSNAYFDSVPLICITGQVATFREKQDKKMRQYGFQETDVVEIFKPITKYAVKINRAEDIKFELGKALYIARSGRPGPVVVDLPDNLQRVEINPDSLKSFQPEIDFGIESLEFVDITAKLNSLLDKSEKPLMILGAGIRIGNSAHLIENFINELNVPFVTTWGAKDLISEDNFLNIGTFGVCGPRYGNWAISECDLVIVLGSRLNQMQVGGKLGDFAANAFKVLVDIDQLEIDKFKSTDFKLDWPINLDVNDFLHNVKLKKYKISNWHGWLAKIKSEFSIISEHLYDKKEVNAYQFIHLLSDLLPENSIIFTDAGGNLCWTMQGFKIKYNQRLISSWNHSPMGFSLPAAIGASFANPQKTINCVIGDGGLMMCLQELGTVARHNLPINIYIFNNRGHGIQKQTIDTWLNGNQIGVDHETGLFFPNFRLIADSFGIAYERITHINQVVEKVNPISSKPVIYDVMINPEQKIFPMLKFGGNLTDLDDSIPKPKYSPN
jgi:acetolactate synthase-1/2/3 large subunit